MQLINKLDFLCAGQLCENTALPLRKNTLFHVDGLNGFMALQTQVIKGVDVHVSPSKRSTGEGSWSTGLKGLPKNLTIATQVKDSPHSKMHLPLPPFSLALV